MEIMTMGGTAAASRLMRTARMGALVCVALVAVACEPGFVASGGNGSDGIIGPAGPPGLPAIASPHLVWVDATGAFVSDDFPRLVDATGMIWPINIETGRVYLQLGADPFYFRKYESMDCTGPAHITPIGAPRYVIAAADQYVTRADDVEATTFAGSSYVAFGGACTITADPDPYASVLLIPEASLRRLGTTPPALSFMPPLHQEVR